ncbi:winged helix-turn-helix domain-containing protein [Geothrix sp. PMB-07]|uniref:winged helix-turn-helix domain-containing protein n=1 Tax=Geothrix sp. PMB-07 TaxID=3068640 RepID=UPI0027419F4E|nr:LysR family transcriptional regulator [Geothrix sp. PMB-07]WLT32155.1 LysR family transcriptional regulator [Geothrix sp. PMB-07]
MTKPTQQAATIRIRIAYGENIAIGQGKADLLEAISRVGSISAAARELDMSYRKAWMLVDEMNQSFKSPVVVAVKGGLQGGGAQVTPLGQEALARFRVIQAKASEAIAEDVKAFRKRLFS